MSVDIRSRTEASYQRGLALHKDGRLADAWAHYQQALQLRPDHRNALHQMGVIALQTNRPDIAIELIGKAILIDPGSAVTHINHGRAHFQLHRHEAALASFERAIALKPDYADAHHQRGIALYELKRYEAAVASYERAIALNADHADANNNLGVALAALGRHAAALASYDRAIALKPGHAMAHSNRGVALAALDRWEPAVASYDEAIALKPDYADAYNDRGMALAALKRHEDALASYERAIALKSDHADAHCHRGDSLRALKRYEAAVASYEQAIALRPEDPIALNNLGIALVELKRYEAALASYGRAIEMKPDYAEAYNNRGNALGELKQFAAAVTSFKRAAALGLRNATVLNNLGKAFGELQQYEASLASYDEALALDPEFKFLRGIRLFSRLQICDWREFDREQGQLLERIERGETASSPFCCLALSESAALQKKTAQTWVQEQYVLNTPRPAPALRAGHEKIRIGYFSGDFRDHPVSILAAQLFELHDRSRFELTAFSYGPDTQDDMRKRLRKAFDRFIDVQRQSDQEITQLARSLGVDIAVDLGGFTQDSRAGIFALRAAPLQVSYLGYAGTLGAPFMDYLIADATLIPESHREHYSEKIIYLPDSFMVNDSQRPIAERVFTREELGLPPVGFVFCCFTNTYKITPGTFGAWMRILKRVEGSVLWLSQSNATAVDNLRREAHRSGVDAQRLIFAERMPTLPDHLARHRAADLFLDTLPYNAHTRAADALWAGLPVLTCMGGAFAGRVAASLLNAIGLPELITSTKEQYEELAVELATDGRGLAAIRHKLAENRLTTPLFDTQRFTKHLEAAYLGIYERHQAHLPNAHVDRVADLSKAAPA